jgi:hypothetical protein
LETYPDVRDPLRDLSTVSYGVIQSLKKLSKIGGLAACKERSALQDQYLLLNLGLHFVSSGLRLHSLAITGRMI